MKKQHKSFAERARQLESRYKRLAFDPIEQKEFEEEMTKLQQEQEMVRSAMGMNQQEQPMQEFNYGGKLMMQGDEVTQFIPTTKLPGLPDPNEFDVEDFVRFNRSGFANQAEMQDELKLKGYDPRQINTMLLSPRFPSSKGMLGSTDTQSKQGSSTKRVNTTTAQTTPVVNTGQQVADPSGWNAVLDNITNYAYKAPEVQPGQTTNNFMTSSDMPARDNKYTQNLAKELNPANADVNKFQRFWDANKQYAPYALSGVSNIASNLLLANMAKKNKQRVNPILATPEKMNMEAIAEKLRKDASVSKNIGMKNARDLGLNAGATLANMGAIGSGVDRQLGDNLTSLYGQQEQYNVGTANQFSLRNQDAGNRTNMINAQFGQQSIQDQLGYLSGALGTIPGVMKDIRMDKADKETREIMESYYKSLGGRNYLPLGSIFESGGFKYKVKGYNPDGTPITEQVK